MSQRALLPGMAAVAILLVVTTLSAGCRATDKSHPASDANDELSMEDLPEQDATFAQAVPRWRLPDDATGIGPLSEFVVPATATSPVPEAGGQTEPSVPAAATTFTSAIQRTVEHIEADEFEETVLTSDEPVLVDFYMDRCGPCNMLAPILDELARETPDVRVVKVNATRSAKLKRAYGVQRFPTVMVFKQGQPISRHVGLADRATLERMLSE